MDYARHVGEWNHTATLCAHLANIHRDRRKRSRPYTPSDFHPFAKRHPMAGKTPAGIEALKVFLKPAAK